MLMGAEIMEFNYNSDSSLDRYQQFAQFISDVRVSLPSHPVPAIMPKDGEDILFTLNEIYPADKKNALGSVLHAFLSRDGSTPFNELLFGLLFQLKELETFKNSEIVSYKVGLLQKNMDKIILQEKKLLEIEQVLLAGQHYIFSAAEMAEFRPEIMENLALDSLSAVQQEAVFMLLSCAQDKDFSGFCKNVYTYRIGGLLKVIKTLGDETSLKIGKLIEKAQSYF